MFKVIFTDKFYELLNTFLESYKNIFKKLYSDTGIPDENILFQTYVASSKKIEEDIIDEIEKTLQEEVFGYKLQNGEKSIKIYLRSFMLEVFFEEDLEEKIRFIENIIINKK